MRTPTITRVFVAALLATGALAVAGCGGTDSGGDSASAADRERDNRKAALDHARCMREHGVDMPDPTFGEGIRQVGPAKGTSPSKLRKAEEACKKYLEAIEPPKLSEEQQEEFRQAALAHARCMREHGIENFPDPIIGEGGRMTQKLDKASGIDPEDPDFREAEEACQDTLPKRVEREQAP